MYSSPHSASRATNELSVASQQAYTDAQRAAVITQLECNGGNVSLTSRETGIRRETIIKWRDAVAPALARQVSAPVADSADTLAEMVSAELQHIGFGNLSDVVSWDAEGKLSFVPSDQLSPRQAAIVQEVKVKRRRTVEADELREIEDISIRTRDKLGALNSLAKISGLMPTAGATVNVNTGDTNTIVLQQLASASLEQLRDIARGGE